MEIKGFIKSTTPMDVNQGNVNNIQVDETVNESNVDYNRVYLYSDLSFGSLAHVNRDLNYTQVNKIYRGLKDPVSTEWRLGEIYVDIETKEIIDGNNRYYALFKYLSEGGKLKEPIRVLYKKRPDGISVANAVNLYNSDRKQWTADDYATSMKKQGDKFVLELDDFCRKNKFLHKEIIDKKTGKKTIKPIYRYGGWFIKGINCSPLLKKNIYSHTTSEIEEAQVVYNEVEEMLRCLDIDKTGTWFGEFVAAWKGVREELKTEINALPNKFKSLLPVISTKMYLNKENIVNQLEPNKNKLRDIIVKASCDARRH